MAIVRRGGAGGVLREDQLGMSDPGDSGVDAGAAGGQSTPSSGGTTIGLPSGPVPPVMQPPVQEPVVTTPQGNATKPSEGSVGSRPPDVPSAIPDSSRVTGPGGGAIPQPTPSRPMEPTPVASQTPQPFTPMSPAMSASDTTIPGIVRRSVVPGGPNSQGSMLLGKAGGLLGGGLGVPGVLGTQDSSDLSDLILNVLKRANS